MLPDDLLGVENLFRDEQKKVKKRKKTAKSTLSFAMDDDDHDGGGDTPPSRGEEADGEKPSKRSKLGKNPNVDTSFLPDRQREEEERRQREQLRQEWLKNQEDMKTEEFEITYSYWDGSGHRKSVTVGCFSFSRQFSLAHHTDIHLVLHISLLLPSARKAMKFLHS